MAKAGVLCLRPKSHNRNCLRSCLLLSFFIYSTNLNIKNETAKSFCFFMETLHKKNTFLMKSFANQKNLPTFAPVSKRQPCPDGGIGRRAGLKHQCRKASRFEPGSGYHKRVKLFIFKHLTLFLFKIVPILFPVILNTKDIRLTGCRVFIQKLRYYISKKQYTYYSLNMIYSYEALLQRHSPR